MNWNDMSEHKIKLAQADGLFDGLKGAGKPLTMRGAEDISTVGHRMMADAGVVPREIELKKAVVVQRKKLALVSTPEEKKIEMTVLADLELRLAIEQEVRRKFYGTF